MKEINDLELLNISGGYSPQDIRDVYPINPDLPAIPEPKCYTRDLGDGLIFHTC